MHVAYARINNVSAFLSTCLMVLLAAITCTSLLFYADPKGALSINSFKVYYTNTRRNPYAKQDQARVVFNTTTDLRPLLNWNTKQLFVWVQAEYTNTRGVESEVVVWDSIIRRKEDALIDFGARKNKYHWHDTTKRFNGSQPAHFSLRYNVMPYVGMLTYGEAARTTEPLVFPASEIP